ncbi:MAG: 50S ribosomal protein L22 [Planctomycetota bacterium]
MPYTNIHRTARISPTKVRLITNLIKGKPVVEAETLLKFSKQRAAVFVRDALLAAAANADHLDGYAERDLVVTDARVDSGPTIKRFQPKDRGRAHPILKRTSHITVSVDVPEPAAAPA